EPGLARLSRAPVVVGAERSRFPRREHALGVRVPPPLGISLGRDEHVRAHRVELAPAERAAVRRRLPALRRPRRPPLRVLRYRTGLAAARDVLGQILDLEALLARLELDDVADRDDADDLVVLHHREVTDAAV